ncbi:MAG: universal stress protein [Chloroflexota bacterium]|nr:universal stress protein [Chloroflexota bacterium]
MQNSIRKILVPVSGTSADEEAVKVACSLLDNDRKAAVIILYVLHVDRSLPLDADLPAASVHGEEVLTKMESIGRKHKRRTEGAILQARDFGPAIVSEALERSADLIVIGTPREQRYGAPIFGETALYILRHSPTRVIVNREGASTNGRSA